MLQSLPDDFGQLSKLKTISLAGNRLAKLPASISGLVELQDLGLQGNQLTEARAELGNLSRQPPHHKHRDYSALLGHNKLGLSNLCLH